MLIGPPTGQKRFLSYVLAHGINVSKIFRIYFKAFSEHVKLRNKFSWQLKGYQAEFLPAKPRTLNSFSQNTR